MTVLIQSKMAFIAREAHKTISQTQVNQEAGKKKKKSTKNLTVTKISSRETEDILPGINNFREF